MMSLVIEGLSLLGLIIGLGSLAAYTERNPRVGRWLALSIVLLIAMTLLISIFNGDLLRYEPGAQDDLGEEREFTR